ncbi:MAG: hypothetical protein C0615_09395 [Desulfuromonas sp.]|nr:MAG: hypothetical protein C0615_09395 [Desulfuromonas sp.]
MLQMKCPQCEGTIKSPFLVEIGNITCQHCKETVTVNDVFVATKSFTMHRDALLTQIKHYRNLLKNVEQEKSQLIKNDSSSSEAQSLDQYHSSLRELLEASRENYRLRVSQNLPLRVAWKEVKSPGRVLNISTKGAAILTKGLLGALRQDDTLQVLLGLPGADSPLKMTARIAWQQKREQAAEARALILGVQFQDMDRQTHGKVWDYIMTQSDAPEIPENPKHRFAAAS